MILDVYAGLFDDDLDSVTDAPDDAVSLANVPKNLPTGLIWAKQRPRFPLFTREAGPFSFAVTVGFEPISSSPQFRGKS
jgi:hypothetical protein